MKKFETDKIRDLTEVFFSVMGGEPESIKEIEEFMQKSPLRRLMFASDMERVLKFDGYFAEEVADAVYALLPVKIPLNDKQKMILTPQAFHKLNQQVGTRPACRVINISFPKAMEIYDEHFNDKISKVISTINDINQKKAQSKAEKTPPQESVAPSVTPETPKTAPTENKPEVKSKTEIEVKTPEEKIQETQTERMRLEEECRKLKAEKKKLSEEYKKVRAERKRLEDERQKVDSEKAKLAEARKEIAAEKARLAEERKKLEAEEKELEEKREKKRLYMRKRRAEHPEARKSYYKPFNTLPPEEQERLRAANKSRNAVYREKNREKLRLSHNERRAKLKAENPELLKSMDKMHNENANRKEIGQRYYQKHKEEIKQKAQANPMVKVYKKRYETKKRLEKTGPVLASLLQGLIAAKSKD